MNDGEKIWRRLSGKEMRVETEIYNVTYYNAIKSGVDELREVFDSEYALADIRIVVNPATYGPVAVFYIQVPTGGVFKVRGDILDDRVTFRGKYQELLDNEKVR